MDLVDKRIIQILLNDGRIPQKKIADELGISAQALKYRFDKLIQDGVIKKFVLHVTPEFFGKNQGFAAFRTDQDYENDIFSRFKCLEDIAIFGFQGNSQKDLDDAMKRAYEKLGDPVMRYTPPSRGQFIRLSDTDVKLIDILRRDPRLSISSIAAELGISGASAKKRIERLREKRIASVIPILDLSKTDAVLFLLFSDNPSEIMPVILSSLIFQISDGKSGISVCFSDSLANAKMKINNVRKIDEKSEVMVVYDYDFLT